MQDGAKGLKFNTVDQEKEKKNDEMTYQTYYKQCPKEGIANKYYFGHDYAGRTSGTAGDKKNISNRYKAKQEEDRYGDFGPAKLKGSSTWVNNSQEKHPKVKTKTNGQCAIRGHEQYLIDSFGGARSVNKNFKTAAANAINSIGPNNSSKKYYIEMCKSTEAFEVNKSWKIYNGVNYSY